MSEPTIAEENKHKWYASEKPIVSVLQCSPGYQPKQWDEQQTTRGVKHGEEEEHDVRDAVARSIQSTNIQTSLADDSVDDEWSTDQDGIQKEGGLVDALSTPPHIGSKRQGKWGCDEHKQGDSGCSRC